MGVAGGRANQAGSWQNTKSSKRCDANGGFKCRLEDSIGDWMGRVAVWCTLGSFFCLFCKFCSNFDGGTFFFIHGASFLANVNFDVFAQPCRVHIAVVLVARRC